MGEAQVAAIALLLTGVLPVYALAEWIRRGKHYSLIAGWDPERITDHEACARVILNGIRGFAFVMGLGSVLLFFGLIGMGVFVLVITILPLVPLLFAIVQANRKYRKR